MGRRIAKALQPTPGRATTPPSVTEEYQGLDLAIPLDPMLQHNTCTLRGTSLSFGLPVLLCSFALSRPFLPLVNQAYGLHVQLLKHRMVLYLSPTRSSKNKSFSTF